MGLDGLNETTLLRVWSGSLVARWVTLVRAGGCQSVLWDHVY